MRLQKNAFLERAAMSVLEEAPAYLKRLGIKPADLNNKTLLGLGAYARAWLLPDGNVLKLTTDRDDAEAAELIRRDGPVPGLIHVLDVRRFAQPIQSREWVSTLKSFVENEEDLYAIVTERIVPVMKTAPPEWKRAGGASLHAAYQAFDAYLNAAAKWRGLTEEEILARTAEDYDDIIEGQRFKDLVAGWRWLEQRGYEVSDIHAGNVGETREGRAVLFDFGADSRRGTGARPEVELAANPEATGDCYALAAKAAQNLPGSRVVHGHVEGLKPVRHHAWVEQRGVVIDPSVDMVASKSDLERRNIRYVAETSYEPEEALVKALRTGHWGPWTEITRNPGAWGANLTRVSQHFNRCVRTVEDRFHDFGDIELKHDERAGGDNGAGAERQFAYCAEGEPIVVAFAAKAEKLPDKNLAGLMAHEFGHALEHRYGVRELERRLDMKLPKGVERRADVIAEAVFGKEIRYDDNDVQCVSCKGTSPRPGYLAKNGPDGLRFVADVRGAHHEQVDMTIYAVMDERYVGRIDFSEFRGQVHIQWIEIVPEQRRAGVARELIKSMLKQFEADGIKYADVDWGMTTPDGTRLRTAMDEEFGGGHSKLDKLRERWPSADDEP